MWEFNCQQPFCGTFIDRLEYEKACIRKIASGRGRHTETTLKVHAEWSSQPKMNKNVVKAFDAYDFFDASEIKNKDGSNGVNKKATNMLSWLSPLLKVRLRPMKDGWQLGKIRTRNFLTKWIVNSIESKKLGTKPTNETVQRRELNENNQCMPNVISFITYRAILGKRKNHSERKSPIYDVARLAAEFAPQTLILSFN